MSRYKPVLLVPIVLGLVSGCFGDPEPEFSSVRLKNLCGAPVVAELTQLDGASLVRPVTIDDFLHTYLSLKTQTVAAQPAIRLVLRAEGQVIWVDDDVTLANPAFELVITGVCGSDSVCEDYGQRIECLAKETQPIP